jgi:RNA polymerase sigma factor (sigma-70 family)
MSDSDDMACLREYVRTGSQPAFAQIVRRRGPMVHAAAMRQVRDAHAAEDVTQTVFIILDRKAPLLVKRDVLLSAWLLTTARYAAIHARRRTTRRRKHERQAAGMKRESLDGGDGDFTSAHMHPVLDEALDGLREGDRRVIAMRYFDNRGMRSVAEALGCSEEAARQRLGRAIERLRTALGVRGADLMVDLIASLLPKDATEESPAFRPPRPNSDLLRPRTGDWSEQPSSNT